MQRMRRHTKIERQRCKCKLSQTRAHVSVKQELQKRSVAVQLSGAHAFDRRVHPLIVLACSCCVPHKHSDTR
eukprot:4329293-Pleurochrysis_carterae.AAC.5